MDTYDVVIVGGGAAGLAAAVTLARSLRSVLVVDAGQPRNAPAEGVHNLLGREGIAPADLIAAGRREAEDYGARIRDENVVAARRSRDDAVELDLASGSTVRGRRLLLATGLRDELPDIPGVSERWGHTVLHCPYCHGWEVRGRRIGILGASPMSVHQVLLFRQLSDEVTLFRHTMPDLEPEAAEQLAALEVRVVDGAVTEVRGAEGEPPVVVLADGDPVEVDALTVAPRFVARTELYEQLGGTPTEHPTGVYLEADPMGKTDVPGVWAAGNVSNLMATVAASSAAGVAVAGALNADLVAADAAEAVRRRAA